MMIEWRDLAIKREKICSSLEKLVKRKDKQIDKLKVENERLQTLCQIAGKRIGQLKKEGKR